MAERAKFAKHVVFLPVCVMAVEKTAFHPRENESKRNDKWPPSSPDLIPLDYHVCGVVPERYKSYHSKPKNVDEQGQFTAGLNQQGRSELHKMTSSLSES